MEKALGRGAGPSAPSFQCGECLGGGEGGIGVGKAWEGGERSRAQGKAWEGGEQSWAEVIAISVQRESELSTERESEISTVAGPGKSLGQAWKSRGLK